MAYSVDTSYLIEAWTVWFPYSEFAGVWRVFATAAAHNHMFVIDRVYDELSKHVPDLVQFFDKNAPGWVTDTANDSGVMTALSVLEQQMLSPGTFHRVYHPQNVSRYVTTADPVLVLHAQLYSDVVVSIEVSNINARSSPKIPDLCQLRGVVHVEPPAFIATLGHTFGP